MDEVVLQAIENIHRKYAAGEWPTVPPTERTALIYSEIRRLDQAREEATRIEAVKSGREQVARISGRCGQPLAEPEQPDASIGIDARPQEASIETFAESDPPDTRW